MDQIPFQYGIYFMIYKKKLYQGFDQKNREVD